MKPATVFLSATLLAAFAAAPVLAEGKTRHVEGTVTTERGTGTFTRDVTRADGVRTAPTNATGPNGGTRTVTRTCAKGSGCSYEGTATGPKGNTRSFSGEGRRKRK